MNHLILAATIALLGVACNDHSSTGSKTNQKIADAKHPESSLDILKGYVHQQVDVLDIGSGSGIGPRQLIANGFSHVIVLEDNQKLVNDAKAANMMGSTNVEYIVGQLNKGLPYEDGKFELITAFAAFHCKTSPEAIKEVYRLLRPDGFFFIIRGLKKNSDPVRIETTKIIESMTGKKSDDSPIDAVKFLKDQGFKIVLDTTVPVTEYFTKEEYFNYMKSYCSWDLVKDSPKHAEIEQKIGQYLDTVKDNDGVIKIEMMAPVILAQKPSQKAEK